MTARTRRRLTFCFVLGLIALPVEALLLPIARTPDATTAAQEWVADRSTTEIADAVANIENYPAAYRRAIMATLSPADRAAAWRSHFDRFISTHPELTASQRAIIEDAKAALTPAAFEPPLSPEVQAKVTAVFEAATKSLGPTATKELFVTMGPQGTLAANALPLSQQIADKIRAWRVSSADTPGCNCNIDIDTCDVWPEEDWLQCSELYTCGMDLSWPMCGPLWSWACTGWCRVKIWPEAY
ncbi:MAG TPA: bacteriocin fulvocin C-related protein [Vicinamibacterales bacterium]|nr:bacteriocin fulvocin C-related protein [Vicinamibacterales bacterium]